MVKLNSLRSIFVFCIFTLIACSENANLSPGIAEMDPSYSTPESALFVTNEGAFQQLNGSISVIDTEFKEIENEVFKNVNDQNLGDIVQSLAFGNDQVFAMINGSEKIVIFDEDNFEQLDEIKNISFPNYMYVADDSKAYVTTNLISSLVELDLTSHSTARSINIPGQAQEIVGHGNHLYVSSLTPYNSPNAIDHLYIIDATTMQLIDSIEVGISPSTLMMLDDNTLAVGCIGTYGIPNAELFLIDLEENKVLDSTYLPYTIAYVPRLAYNAEKRMLYTLVIDGIIGYDLENFHEDPIQFFKTEAPNNLYALDFDALSKEFYLGYAYDYTTAGKLVVLNEAFEEVRSYQTGIGPNHVYRRP